MKQIFITLPLNLTSFLASSHVFIDTNVFIINFNELITFAYFKFFIW